MAQSVKDLAEAARALSPVQQAELIDELITGLSSSDADWNDVWSREAGERWAKHRASGHAGHAAEDVLAEVAAHLARRRKRS